MDSNDTTVKLAPKALSGELLDLARQIRDIDQSVSDRAEELQKAAQEAYEIFANEQKAFRTEVYDKLVLAAGFELGDDKQYSLDFTYEDADGGAVYLVPKQRDVGQGGMAEMLERALSGAANN
ncbi:gp34 [Alphaproteobacteria phage PhiJL001]|uniref:Gp34 n=1 Tax=Alphaproteobacteria phage PhiJL001 TaxID=2681607 RepID=Q5DN71_9CAUD|nr:gp34 [Alphaproteobacteria phage PhiJL001]AAT69510.1 gp34 [Alphaproteobacteria phage PhiJL001]